MQRKKEREKEKTGIVGLLANSGHCAAVFMGPVAHQPNLLFD